MLLEKMRNIGIMAHIDAGKTTTTERILYYTKKIHKIGEIDDGQATMDWMAQEQERGITICSAATTTYWKDYQINIIDTPGHVDFTAEVERSLRVLDGAVAVICAVDGVQPQTETVWKQADEFKVPRLCFMNKMDRIGADFFGSMKDVQEKFGVECLALQIPIGEGQAFEGVIDLLRMKELRWNADDEGETIVESDIDESRMADAVTWREKLIDQVASSDDELAELYLDGQEISVEQLKAAIRKGTINRTFVPFVMGSARHNQGVQPLIDAVIDYLPCPTDIPAASGIHIKKDKEETVEVPCDVSKPALGLVFKIQYDREMGSLCYVRMYSGKISSGTQVLNINKKKRERVNRILRMHADKSEPLNEVCAGDIAVFVGLKLAQTGDSVGSEGFPVLLEKPVFPQPVISVALEPESMSERDKMNDTLQILSKEDPTFTYHEDSETGQLIISGMGELHLDVLVTRMKDDFGVQCRVGAPQVTYREAVTSSADCTESFSKVLGGKENTAGITVHVEPREQGAGNSYSCTVRDNNIPEEIYEAVENGFRSSLDSGINYGYPCTDTAVTVTGITYSEETATTFAFEACAAQAFDKVCNMASPQLLEPVMNVDITCPKEFVGEAMSQMTQRGGMIMGQDSKASGDIIHAQAPMAKMFGFSTNLRSATQGRAGFSMEFSHFQVKAGGFNS
ncbi:MAG: elongation factor G [Treponema porcinum]|uniref:elongation factor G n=3 Tax=Treponema porcinum TaxID=261392 RepID=UPI0023578738|nr:elongation factor G [Treponema porcinum]MCI6179277.1 elongation factor G [Treponema porcinum]MCI6815318.1 elongation factor G [Treponema porcinum]MCI7545200.1 elongation factor G [Treponema porcinum]